MKLLLPLWIALRFSRGRQLNGTLSLVSIISIGSIALGVTVLIISLSAMNGFKRELNQRILAVVPHGEIEPISRPFIGWQKILKIIEQVPGIIAVAPYINFTGLIEHDDKLQIIQVRGIDPEQEIRLSALPHFVQNNAWHNFNAGKQQIILGKGVADALKTKLGDWLTIMIHRSDPQSKLLQLKRIRLQVSGILSLGGQLDYSIALVPIADAQFYLNIGQDISGIAIKVDDVFHANQLLIDAAVQITNAYVHVRSWMSTYGYIYRDIQMIRTIMYLAMTLVIGVACFNIVSTLVMAVKDKSVDIAILRTLGAEEHLTSTIFIYYGTLVGFTGNTIGISTGILVSWNLTMLVKWLEYLLGYQLLSGNVYFIDFLPIEIHVFDVIIVLVMVFLLSLLASWYPALRASYINPATVLSGYHT